MKKVDQIKALEYELGRYRKGVGDRDKQIAELREQVGGFREVMQISLAVIGHLMSRVAAPGEDGVMALTILQEDLRAVLAGERYDLRMHRDEASGSIRVRVTDRQDAGG